MIWVLNDEKRLMMGRRLEGVTKLKPGSREACSGW